MRELPHNSMAYFPSALLRFIGRYDYSWTTFWTIFLRLCFDSLAVMITVGLLFGLWFPAFSFTISCGKWLFSGECPGFRGGLSRELLWKVDSGTANGLKIF